MPLEQWLHEKRSSGDFQGSVGSDAGPNRATIPSDISGGIRGSVGVKQHWFPQSLATVWALWRPKLCRYVCLRIGPESSKTGAEDGIQAGIRQPLELLFFAMHTAHSTAAHAYRRHASHGETVAEPSSSSVCCGIAWKTWFAEEHTLDNRWSCEWRASRQAAADVTPAARTDGTPWARSQNRTSEMLARSTHTCKSW